MYTLIVYVTISPLFTCIGSFGCLYSAVVVSSSLPSFNGDTSIFGTLVSLCDKLSPFIAVINFLNAKSKFCGTYSTSVESLKSLFPFSITTIGCSELSLPLTVQYVTFVP